MKNVFSKKHYTSSNIVEGDACPSCISSGREGVIVEREGKDGTFLGCSSYPKCRETGKSKRLSKQEQVLAHQRINLREFGKVMVSVDL